ncbi:MAG: lysophospholipid acyltransferase family protein, partial [Pseudomonadota bacterium]
TWGAPRFGRAASAGPIRARRVAPAAAENTSPPAAGMGEASIGRGDWPRETPLYLLARLVVVPLLKLLFRFRVEGLDRYPTGPVVIVANHLSALDPLFMAAAVPERVLMVGAAEYLKIPFVGWVMRTYGCIPVRRGEADLSAIKDSVRALQGGRKVVIFPEGQISPEPAPPQRGAAVVAARARVAFVPAAIVGSDRVFPMGARMIRLARVSVTFGPLHQPYGTTAHDYEAALAGAMMWVRRRWSTATESAGQRPSE